MWCRILLLGLFFLQGSVYSQGFHSSRNLNFGLPGFSSRQATVFTLYGNSASLAQLSSTALGISTERKFMLAELSTINFSGALINSKANLAVTLHTSGFDGYRESEAGLFAARKLGDKIDVGINFSYASIAIPGYGKSNAVSGEAGVILHLSEQVHAGIQIKNPAGGRFTGSGGNKLPALYSLGILYETSKTACLSILVLKEESQPVNVNAGFKYLIHPRLWAIAGISSSSSSLYMGAGLLLSSFRIEISSAYHQLLGYSPQLSLIVQLKREDL